MALLREPGTGLGAAQAAGLFNAEIAPLTSIMMVQNKETGEFSEKEVTLTQDEGNRPSTTLADLQQAWDEVSWRIARERDNPECADAEHAAVGDSTDPGLQVVLPQVEDRRLTVRAQVDLDDGGRAVGRLVPRDPQLFERVVRR